MFVTSKETIRSSSILSHPEYIIPPITCQTKNFYQTKKGKCEDGAETILSAAIVRTGKPGLPDLVRDQSAAGRPDNVGGTVHRIRQAAGRKVRLKLGR